MLYILVRETIYTIYQFIITVVAGYKNTIAVKNSLSLMSYNTKEKT